MSGSKKTRTRKRKEKVTVSNKKEELSLVVVKPKETALTVISKKELVINVAKKMGIVLACTLVICYILLMIIVASSIFYVSNLNNGKIQNGIFVKGINISNLTQEQAINTLNSILNENNPEYIILKYRDNIYKIALADLSLHYNIEEAVEEAYSIGRTKNVVSDLLEYVQLMNNSVDIDLEMNYDDEILNQFINQISEQLPDKVQEYSYAINDNLLVINSGKSGVKINKDELKNIILANLKSKSFEEIEIPVDEVLPQNIDIEKIHNEIYVEPQDAYFTENPITIYEQIIGVDFNVEQANNIINSSVPNSEQYNENSNNIPSSEQYKIELIFTNPNIFVKDLNIFPDELSTFSTNYVNNWNRTTNLILAANKINGTVLMPGETFSFNKIVGERTVAAGYKNAAIFVNGEVEDGLAGGICQVSSTLYNAAIGANLEITERHNHSKLTSYLPGGKDATVAWGRYDFQFVNNREYPIKIEMSVQNGKANAKISGIKSDNEYEITIESTYGGRAGLYAVYNAYKVYRQNGIEINREFLSRDLYR